MTEEPAELLDGFILGRDRVDHVRGLEELRMELILELGFVIDHFLIGDSVLDTLGHRVHPGIRDRHGIRIHEDLRELVFIRVRSPGDNGFTTRGDDREDRGPELRGHARTHEGELVQIQQRDRKTASSGLGRGQSADFPLVPELLVGDVVLLRRRFHPPGKLLVGVPETTHDLVRAGLIFPGDQDLLILLEDDPPQQECSSRGGLAGLTPQQSDHAHVLLIRSEQVDLIWEQIEADRTTHRVLNLHVVLDEVDEIIRTTSKLLLLVCRIPMLVVYWW